MNDRGMIKWQPFDSVYSSKELEQEILIKRGKISKPILSDEQKNNLETDLFHAYHENIPIKITFFQSNRLFKITKRIIKIILINQKIIFDDASYIYFDQIVNIDL